MRAIFRLAFLLTTLLAIVPAQAVTIYYQPTPYPAKKCAGNSSCPGGDMPQDLEKIHIHDGWVNNYYPSIMSFQRDGKGKFGGWTDIYREYINVDLLGLPANPTNVILWLRFYPSGSSTTPFQFCIPNSQWDTNMTWNSQPSFLGCTQNFSVPSTDSWAGWYITSWYKNWKNGTWGNYGMMLNPQYNGNNFDFIRSSRYADFVNDPYADGKRPILQLDFTPPVGMPNFRMPLPGGASWLLTNEIGGYECKGESPWPDIAHQGNSYFSLDFSPSNVKYAGGSYTGDIPILAAADGIVAYAETNQNVPNGYHIVLNHSGNQSTSNGYTTKYLHFKDRPRRSNGTPLVTGDVVYQGDQIGIMGTTGVLSNGTPTSTAVHLHFGMYYNGSGASSISEITYAVMDGLLMKSYQTECEVNSNGVPTSRIRRFYSSNRAY